MYLLSLESLHVCTFMAAINLCMYFFIISDSAYIYSSSCVVMEQDRSAEILPANSYGFHVSNML